MKASFLLTVFSITSCAATPIQAAAAQPVFEAIEVDGDIKIGYGLAIADVDGDRRLDVLLADKNEIVWYQNPEWEKHVVAENLTQRDNVCIAAADIDGDGKAEIAIGAEWNPGDTENSGAVFYLIPPSDRREKWTPVQLSHEPTTHRMHWIRDWQENWRLVVLPLHGRGNRGGQGAGVKILSYQVPDDPKDEWETRVLNDSFHMTHNFDPVNWDDDIAHEILLAAKEGIYIINWADGGMKATLIGGDQTGGAGEVRLGSLAHGKRAVASIEPMHGNQFVLYAESSSDNDAKSWKRHVVTDTLTEGHALAAGDILGTGSDQYVVGWRGGDVVGIKLFTPTNDEGTTWKEDWIDENTMACEDVKIADLNQDGRLDVIAAGRKTRNVKIYWNKTAR